MNLRPVVRTVRRRVAREFVLSWRDWTALAVLRLATLHFTSTTKAWERAGGRTLLLQLGYKLILIPLQLCPLRELVLRRSRTHLSPEVEDFLLCFAVQGDGAAVGGEGEEGGEAPDLYGEGG